jgi:hypothetical protein
MKFYGKCDGLDQIFALGLNRQNLIDEKLGWNNYLSISLNPLFYNVWI